MSPFRLFRTRRFWPLFVTQFLGAFNDNIYKNAMVILIAYRLGATSVLPAHLLVTAAAGLFILPFFLFSATAGELADSHDKARLIRLVKLAEIVIMLLGALAFALADVSLLMGVLFLMGTHSSFFGPLKYAVLPDHLPADDLVAANGLVEAATFLAVISGTLLGGMVVLMDGGLLLVSLLCILVAVAGYLSSRAIPAAPPAAVRPGLSLNIVTASARILRSAMADRASRMAMIGISWFWFVGATWLAQAPNLAKLVFRGDETVTILFLLLFAVGIAAGSVVAALWLKGRIDMRFAGLMAGLLGFCSLCLPLAKRLVPVADSGAGLRSFMDFLTLPGGPLVALLLCLVAMTGGASAVPLYALIQARAPERARARAIAALNIMNSAFMVASALLAGGLMAMGLRLDWLLAAVGATGFLTLFMLWRGAKAL